MSVRIGFIVVDDYGALYGTCVGAMRVIQYRILFESPKKSATFKHDRVRVTLQWAANVFAPHGTLNISKLVLAYTVEYKFLVDVNYLDRRLQTIVNQKLTVKAGGDDGFNQAIDFMREYLASCAKWMSR
ncbi:Electron transfer flavoprotein alpha-subunit [Phytophthora boehmeriae]|uniref:Electron transfer flavoprotein alpha-subunit n=1 Tax=Phytophthora boehmeriae TaxID=109152 RepID=A0A8T1WE96_9STRA|nr:Electron transfer flavoprotein alpha-subunit [Phytophthora boehmeriae]